MRVIERQRYHVHPFRSFHAERFRLNADVAPVPVVKIAPFVVPGQSANTTFRSGDLRATLARGIFTVQRLALVGNSARVFIDGTVTLSERLNLNVVIILKTVRPGHVRVLDVYDAPAG